MTDGDAIVAKILAEQDEDTAALVLADYLQEHGADALAASLRAAVALRRNSVVYLVSRGSHSDYRVSGVFSSAANAERFMEASQGGVVDRFNSVEEMTLNHGVAEIDRGLLPFFVDMRTDGDQATATRTEPESVSGRGDGDFANYSGERRFVASVWARDAAHAIKIANERRATALAREVPSHE